MLKTLLVDDFKEDGALLLDVLEREHFPITAALWFYLDDEGIWRLVIVTPYVDKNGPLRTYMRIMELLDKLEPRFRLNINNISVMSPKWQQFRDVQRTVENMLRLGIDLRDSTFGEAYVYVWDGKPVESVTTERHRS